MKKKNFTIHMDIAGRYLHLVDLMAEVPKLPFTHIRKVEYLNDDGCVMYVSTRFRIIGKCLAKKYTDRYSKVVWEN